MNVYRGDLVTKDGWEQALRVLARKGVDVGVTDRIRVNLETVWYKVMRASTSMERTTRTVHARRAP